jgi:DNA-binding GntR family transcriptional regulator
MIGCGGIARQYLDTARRLDTIEIVAAADHVPTRATAVELMHEGFSLERIAVRRILDPAATRLASENINEATITELEAEFHSLVARRSDNATLASMLAAVSSRTMRARAWRRVADRAHRLGLITPGAHPETE